MAARAAGQCVPGAVLLRLSKVLLKLIRAQLEAGKTLESGARVLDPAFCSSREKAAAVLTLFIASN